MVIPDAHAEPLGDDDVIFVDDVIFISEMLFDPLRKGYAGRASFDH